MTAYRFKNVSILGTDTFLPEEVLNSQSIEDRIAPLYKRLGIPFGTLERLSGVTERRVWSRSMMPSTAGAEVVKKVIELTGIDKKDIGALISCSVCRDLFEPSTACIMHSKAGLSPDAIAFDLSNACIGFSNGLMVAANMIESGAVKVAVVVSAENPAIIIDSNFELIEKNRDTISRGEFLKLLPTFTLGCGATAYVLVHSSIDSSGHKFLGGLGRTGSEHAELCSGNGDFCLSDNPGALQSADGPIMETESSKLIMAAAELGGETWSECSKLLEWSNDDIDHVICHQVGKQVNEGFYQTMGLPFKKDVAMYQEFGNMVSAALPATISIAGKRNMFKKGDKLVTTAFGSGLNAVFSGIVW